VAGEKVDSGVLTDYLMNELEEGLLLFETTSTCCGFVRLQLLLLYRPGSLEVMNLYAISSLSKFLTQDLSTNRKTASSR